MPLNFIDTFQRYDLGTFPTSNYWTFRNNATIVADPTDSTKKCVLLSGSNPTIRFKPDIVPYYMSIYFEIYANTYSNFALSFAPGTTVTYGNAGVSVILFRKMAINEAFTSGVWNSHHLYVPHTIGEDLFYVFNGRFVNGTPRTSNLTQTTGIIFGNTSATINYYLRNVWIRMRTTGDGDFDNYTRVTRTPRFSYINPSANQLVEFSLGGGSTNWENASGVSGNYVRATSDLSVDLYQMTNIPEDTKNISGVQITHQLGSSTLDISGIVSGNSDYNYTISTGTNTIARDSINTFSTNPVTTGVWTASDINSIYMGQRT